MLFCFQDRVFEEYPGVFPGNVQNGASQESRYRWIDAGG